VAGGYFLVKTIEVFKKGKNKKIDEATDFI
jgi:hypothetical protein